MAYRFFQNLVGARPARREYVRSYVRPRESDCVLDFGCGPGDILEFLPSVKYVGLDMNANYIAAAIRRFGMRGSFRVGKVSSKTVYEEAAYDLVLAVGLVHHMADEEAAQVFRFAARALKPSGRLVTLDGCLVEGQSAIARYLLLTDRGRHVRGVEEYVRLARQVFPTVKPIVRHDLMRIPYTHLILECCPE